MTRSRKASAVATNQSRGVAAPPSLPIVRVSLARTLALKASISSSFTGASTTGTGSAESAAPALPCCVGIKPRFGISLDMLSESAGKTGAARDLARARSIIRKRSKRGVKRQSCGNNAPLAGLTAGCEAVRGRIGYETRQPACKKTIARSFTASTGRAGFTRFETTHCRRTTFPAFSRLEAQRQPGLGHGSDAGQERAASAHPYQSASEAPRRGGGWPAKSGARRAHLSVRL